MSNRIFVRIGQKQEGPFDPTEIQLGLKDNVFTLDMPAWQEGMKKWGSLRDLVMVTSGEAGLDAATARELSRIVEESVGIGRLGYTILMGGICLITYLTLSAITRTSDTDLMMVGSILFLTLLFSAWRLRNIGSSGWWTLLVLIPPATLIVPLICLIAPEHFAKKGTLDYASFFMIILLGLLGAIAAGRYYGW